MNTHVYGAIGAAFLLSACTSLPSQGPATKQIVQLGNAEVASEYGIAFIEVVTDNIIDVGTSEPLKIDQAMMASKAHAVVSAQVGDTIQLRIWEANPDGLFTTTDGPASPISATVTPEGTIFVPYAGNIAVLGLSSTQIRRRIADAFAGKVIDPQIQVEFSTSNMSFASVSGGVKNAGRYQVINQDTKLLDLVSMAGGSNYPAYRTEVSILRSGKTRKILLSDVFANPENNVVIYPSDVVELTERSETFTSFGAVPKRGQIQFPAEIFTLEQAISRSGGLIDTLSDASGVFIFRFEEQMTNAGAVKAVNVPTIYNLDMSKPESFFLAKQFEMEDGDILYVSTAPSLEFKKFLTTIVSPVIGTAKNYQSVIE